MLLLASCSGSKGSEAGNDSSAHQSIEEIFQKVCSADEALELARNSDAVVFETQGCTSGKNVWDTFYEAVNSKSPASVLCAHYYVLDKEHVSEELYEEEKDQYPKLFFYLLSYDGKEFSVKTRESTVEALDSQDTFPYLRHFTGEAPSTARFDSYDLYVLTEHPTVTWEEIEAGLISSQAGAGYKHCTVYRDYLGWK